MIDDDGSEMIEFPEFLKIIKMGGSKSVSKKLYIFLIHHFYSYRSVPPILTTKKVKKKLLLKTRTKA